MAKISQKELNALITTPSALYDAVGATDNDERNAARDAAMKQTFRVVRTELIGAIRSTKVSEDEGQFMTYETALNHLPPSYRPFKKYGREYPAANTVPLSDVSGYVPSEVAKAEQAVKDFRKRKAAIWGGFKAERKDLFDRWFAGDPSVTMDLRDTAKDVSPVY